jgi:hypothetical protein
MIKEPLNVFFDALGTPVSFDGVTVQGLVDDIEELVQTNDAGATSVVNRIRVTVPTAAFEDLRVGSMIEVDGRELEVRERYRTQDGAVTELYCSTP